MFKKSPISPLFSFAQIYKIYGYGQYKMHDNVINVLQNVHQTQFILASTI